MSSHGRSVDLNAPAYLEGVRIANLALDAGEGISASQWIRCGEAAQLIAHNQENVDWYHFARGFADTMREFVEGQGS